MATTSGPSPEKTPATGLRTGMLQVLRHDRFTQAALVVFALTAVLYVLPLLEAAERARLSTAYAPLASLALLLAALAHRLGRIHDAEERRFWRDLLVGFSCWFLVCGLYVASGAGWLPSAVDWRLPIDGIYGLYYLGWILASERRPDRRYRFRPTALEHNLAWPSVSVFVAGLLAYFWLTTLLIDRAHYDSWQPSMELYLVVDSYLLARFAYLTRSAHDTRWRTLYGTLTAGLTLLLLNDAVEASFYVGGPRADWGAIRDVFWLLPFVVFIPAVRLRHVVFAHAPETDPTTLRHWQNLPSPSGRTLIFALTFPTLHFVLQAFTPPPRPALIQARELVVLISIGLLGSIAYLQHRLLERRARELWLERLRIEKALRKSEDALRLSLERSQTEEAIHASEEKFYKIFHSSPAAMGIATVEEGRFIDANRGYERLTGYTRREIVGRTAQELGLWWHPEQRAQMVRRLEEGGSIGDLQVMIRTKGGAKRIVWFALEKLEIDGERCLLSVAHDVTDRHEVGEKTERKAALLDQAAAAVYALDLRDRITFWSPGAERLFGWSAQEAIGQKARDLLGFEPVDAGESEHAARAPASTKDGRKITIDLRSIPVLGHNGELRSRLVLGAERREMSPLAEPNHVD